MSGEKVEGERVRGSSAEGGTHHRCTSGPKKGKGPLFSGRDPHIWRGGGAEVSANDNTPTNFISFFKPFRISERLYSTVKSP